MHVQIGRCAVANARSRELCGQSHTWALRRKPSTCQIASFPAYFSKADSNSLSLIAYPVALYPLFGCLLNKTLEGTVRKTSPHLDYFSGRTFLKPKNTVPAFIACIHNKKGTLFPLYNDRVMPK